MSALSHTSHEVAYKRLEAYYRPPIHYDLGLLGHNSTGSMLFLFAQHHCVQCATLKKFPASGTIRH